MSLGLQKMAISPEIREENRRMRYLRLMIDLTMATVQQSELPLREALEMVEDVKKAACNLFPEKEAVFELIYRPRFLRILGEKFGAEVDESLETERNAP